MTLDSLVNILRENGIVGAGGAGFPSYAKLDSRADTIILNCAECEPLLRLHRQVLEKYSYEILSTLDIIADAVGAETVIVAVKGSYTAAVDSVKANIGSFKKIKIGLLPEIYPAGDEVVAIYETTGRVVAPGSLPISVGATVFNVETVFNIYNAITSSAPVTHKYVTVCGEVCRPITVKAPIGTSFKELIKLAGGAKSEDFAVIHGGPMTGRISGIYDVVTKTTNAVLVLPKTHYVVQKKLARITIDMKRAMSACCQCRVCTDLCSRHLLGHPIEPHAFMRTATSGKTTDLGPFMNTMYCSGCGICEMYACMQGLSPRTLISAFKGELRKNGVKPADKPIFKPVTAERKFRRIPMKRLILRIGLGGYDMPAPLDESVISPQEVKIALSQHIGAPAKPVVKKGDSVSVGQVIASAAEKALSVNIHASVNGTVKDINDKYIIIE